MSKRKTWKWGKHCSFSVELRKPTLNDWLGILALLLITILLIWWCL